MARRSAGALIPGLSLDRSGKEPLSRQLYSGLRELVIAGRLEPGTRMPASRSFAADLQVSRTTVAQAYDQLKSEGYLSGQEKSGTFVTRVLPDVGSWRPGHAAAPGQAMPGTGAPLAERMRRTAPRGPSVAPWHCPSTRASRPSRLFRRLLYARIQRQASLELIRSGAARCPAEGATVLREQIASYLGASRGVVCDPAQVFIISGTHQALHLVLLAPVEPR